MKVLILIPLSKYAKNVSRDLVYGSWCKGKRIAGNNFPPLSLLSITTVLKKAGLEADLLDASAQRLTIDDMKEKIKDYNFVIMLTSTATLNEDADILNILKKASKNLKTIVFGGHVTAEPESTLKRPGIDIVVRQEGEFIIRDLLLAFKNNSNWKETRGISFLDNGKYIKNEDYPLEENLDILPVPDRSLLPENIHYYNPIVKRLPYTTMATTRGCPGLCTFCSSPTFYGRRIRAMSTERVMAEIREIVKLGYKEIFFRDEIFTAFKDRVMKICDEIIKEKIDITWICSARIPSVDREMMAKMKQAGCHMIRFGVETGVQELLDNIKKGQTLQQVENVFKWTHELGLDTHAHMMIGVPGETRETIEQTIEFILRVDPTIVTFGICTPHPGTQLFTDLKAHHPEFGDGTEMDLSKLHTHTFYNEYFTSLTSKELQKYIRKVYRKFYMRPSYVYRWIKRINSIDEFKRVILAGTNVFGFISGKD